MRRSVYVGIFSIFLLMVIVCAVPCFVYAQDETTSGAPEGGIQISPSKFVWNLQSGETHQGRVIVKNYSDIQQHVQMEVEDFYIGADGERPELFVPEDDDPMKAYDVIDWFTKPDDFTLEPGEARAIEFAIKVPDEQPTNGYYGTLLFRTGGGEDVDGSQIGISYRIGALVIMAIQGEEEMDINGELTAFYPEKKVFFDTPSILFATVDNTGNIHYPLLGDIEIRRWGKVFHKIELDGRLLYPSADPTTYREVIPTRMWDFGLYKAHITMHSEDGSVQLSDDTTFIILPWKGIAIIVGTIFAIVMFKRIFSYFFHIERKKKS